MHCGSARRYRIVGADVDGPDDKHMHIRGSELVPSIIAGDAETVCADMLGPAHTRDVACDAVASYARTAMCMSV